MRVVRPGTLEIIGAGGELHAHGFLFDPEGETRVDVAQQAAGIAAAEWGVAMLTAKLAHMRAALAATRAGAPPTEPRWQAPLLPGEPPIGSSGPQESDESPPDDAPPTVH